jgi:hypothetical protein
MWCGAHASSVRRFESVQDAAVRVGETLPATWRDIRLESVRAAELWPRSGLRGLLHASRAG